jgi:hypothetical protein
MSSFRLVVNVEAALRHAQQYRADDEHADQGDQRGDDGGGEASRPQAADLQPRVVGPAGSGSKGSVIGAIRRVGARR